jgi:hypothetical protein
MIGLIVLELASTVDSDDDDEGFTGLWRLERETTGVVGGVDLVWRCCSTTTTLGSDDDEDEETTIGLVMLVLLLLLEVVEACAVAASSALILNWLVNVRLSGERDIISLMGCCFFCCKNNAEFSMKSFFTSLLISLCKWIVVSLLNVLSQPLSVDDDDDDDDGVVGVSLSFGGELPTSFSFVEMVSYVVTADANDDDKDKDALLSSVVVLVDAFSAFDSLSVTLMTSISLFCGLLIE